LSTGRFTAQLMLPAAAAEGTTIADAMLGFR
jgi:hypothetical protein